MSEYIFEPFLTELKKYCYMLAGTPWNGEDLFQDTLIKLLTNNSSLSEHPTLKDIFLRLQLISGTTQLGKPSVRL